MKNLFLLLGFAFLISAGTVSAQTCSHGAKTAEAKSCAKPSETAMKAAANDPSIETKVCENGSVCFMKMSKDAQGNVSKTAVRYDDATASFVSIPSTEASAGGAAGKSCSSSKACCAKGAANGKACCKSKSTAAVQTENAAPAPQTKSE